MDSWVYIFIKGYQNEKVYLFLFVFEWKKRFLLYKEEENAPLIYRVKNHYDS